MDDPEATLALRWLDAASLHWELDLSPGQLGLLTRYLDLLAKWNEVYNLTAVRDRRGMLTHHLLDCLSIVPLVRRLAPQRLLDVGTGAGLPGIVIAIALPEVQVTLLDAVQKKTAFLIQATAELALKTRVQHARVEALTPSKAYDCITSRAFTSLGQMVGLCAPQLADEGLFVAMKGAPDAHELDALPPGFEILASEALDVPHLDAARCAIVIGRSGRRTASAVAMRAAAGDKPRPAHGFDAKASLQKP